MRKLNEMFHIEGEQLIKTSNGQPVPEDEPLFILRGRDKLSVYTLIGYLELCAQFAVPADRIGQLEKALAKFREFAAKEEATKLPGVTHGA